METIEQLKARLAVLEKQMADERKRDDDKEKAINSNPEMVKILKERKENDEKLKAIRKKEEKLERRIIEQFLVLKDYQNYTNPQFQHKTSNWGRQTNIREEVLFQIDCHSSLYLLTNDDIQSAVKRLIEKAIAQSPELVKLKSELTTRGAIDNTLYHKERDLNKELRAKFASDSKVYYLQLEISKIIGQIRNPTKAIEQEKRDSKRSEARNNLYNPSVIDEIYSKLKIRIPKGEN